jgi:transcriptional regulator with XRE-family HTH domain
MELKVALGRVVRRLREETGLSQERFAISVGVDRTVWTSIEVGRRNLSLASLERVATALGLDTGQLLTQAENERRQKRR